MGIKNKVRNTARRIVGQTATSSTAPFIRDSAAVYRALRQVGEAYPDQSAVEDLTRYELRVFSQNGEDGVVLEILQRIGSCNKFFVEFGAGTGHEGNCVLLADVFGWSGLFIESDDAKYAGLEAKYAYNPRVRTLKKRVSPDNVAELFRDADVPEEPGVVSIDIDGHDYWVFMALEPFRPSVVVIEYNGALDPESTLVKPLDDESEWDGTAYFGASLGALRDGAQQKGYVLAHTELAGVNAFFVREELAGLVAVSDPPRRSQNFWLQGGAFASPPADVAWHDVGGNGDSG